jgi:hypothetical protein
MMKKVCLECGKTFEAPPSIAKRRVFCSKPCMWKAFKDNPYFEGYRQKRRQIYDRVLRRRLGFFVIKRPLLTDVDIKKEFDCVEISLTTRYSPCVTYGEAIVKVTGLAGS